MPTKWPPKAALTGWFPISNSGQKASTPRVEPPLTRHVRPDDLPVAVAAQPDPALSVLEHYATPGEFMGERDAALAAGNIERLALLDGSLTGKDLMKFTDLQPFRRVPLASGATMYRGPGGRRRLLIGFGGRGDWIGPPTPTFLQCIDATRWDVLILRDPQLCHFRKGVAGIGKNFAAVTKWLAPKAALYNHVTCMGYSAGGLPAVWAGMALGVDRVICVSAQRPRDVKRLFTGSTAPTPFDAACACIDGAVSRPFVYFHAAKHQEDADTAKGLAEQTGGLAVGAAGYSMHSLLGYMWMRGHLQGFIDLALTAPLNGNLQQRMTRHVRTPAAPFLSPRTNQIPTVAKGVAPHGD